MEEVKDTVQEKGKKIKNKITNIYREKTKEKLSEINADVIKENAKKQVNKLKIRLTKKR